MTAAIGFTGVHQHYPGTAAPVLSGIDLEITAGEFCVVLGRSGTGKSTLLRCINGFVRPQQGTVTVMGDRVSDSTAALRRVRRRTGFIFQGYNLVNRLTVLENVLCGMLGAIPGRRAIPGLFTRAEREQAYRLLDVVGLAEHASKRADQLSGGQKQRIGIARALAQGPSIILADEPVASLDPVTSVEILTLLQEINQREGLTVVISLHQVEFARRFGERIIALQGGEIAVDTSGSCLSDTEITRIYGAAPVVPLTAEGVAA